MLNPIVYLSLIALLTLTACGNSNTSESAQNVGPSMVETLPVETAAAEPSVTPTGTPAPVAVATPTPHPEDSNENNRRCEVKFDYQKIWDGGYVVEVHIINNVKDYKNWIVGFAVPKNSRVEGVWDADVILKSSRIFIVRDQGKNAEVPKGKSLHFGLEVSRDKKGQVFNANHFFLNGRQCKRAK